jgi:hypothetical protein
MTKARSSADFAAGGFFAGKNKIINGDMEVWQRGSSTTLTNNTFGFGPDRFRAYVTFSAGTASFARQTFTPGAAPVAGYEGEYFARITCGSTTTYTEVSQRIEDVRTFAGQTATVSFWAKASASLVFTPYLIQSFGSGGSGDVLIAASNITLTTSWVRYTATVSVPSISGKTIGANNTLIWALTNVSGTLNSATIDLWGVQVEQGSTATTFQTATGTIQGELAACQRYYTRLASVGSATEYWFGSGFGGSSTRAQCILPLTSTMRSSTITLDYSGVRLQDYNAGYAISSLTYVTSARNNVIVEAVSTGLTTNRPYAIDTTTTGYIGISAEL